MSNGGGSSSSSGKGPQPSKPLILLYSSQADAAYLLKGFTEGFRIPCQGPQVIIMSQNLCSVKGLENVGREKIGKELREGHVIGPFISPLVPKLQVSPLGIVPKKAPGEFCLIHHLSYPQGQSVNDAISDGLCTVR